MTEPATTQHSIVIPSSIAMVALLGPRDDFLRIIEREFGADVHVRGNTITITGPPAEAALVERLLDELVTMIRTGQGLSNETVERSIVNTTRASSETEISSSSTRLLSSA